MTDELTAQRIKWLPIPEPPDALRDFPDGRVPGLTLRVFVSGRRGWYLKYRQHGRQRRYKLGDYPTLGLAAARKKAERMRVEVRDGSDPVRDRRDRKDATTVGGLIEQYLDQYAPKELAPKTVAERTRILRGDDLRELRQLVPVEVTPRDLAKALDRIERRGARIMLNRTQVALSALFRWAVQRQRAGLVANPVRQLERRFKEHSRDRWLDADEILAMWHDIKGRTIGASTAMQLVLITAQRPGDVAKMQWSHIQDATWAMPEGYRKAVRGQDVAPPHDVHLSSLALEILDAVRVYHHEHKTAGRRRYVFPNPDAANGHILYNALSQAGQRVNRALRKAGRSDKRWTPHDLRRTASTHMTALGHDRLIVDKVLGHKDPTVAGIYDRHAYWDERTAALDAWAERLRDLVHRN